MLAAPTGSRVGSRSTRRRSRKDIGEGRWRDYGREAVFEYCEEDVRDVDGCCCASNCAAAPACRRRRRARAALVELQRQGGRADPGARHADRHAAVESGAGEQGRRHRRPAAAVRSELRQRRSDLHARGRVELRAIRAVARPHRRDGVAAPGERPARYRRRRLPADVPRARDRRPARAAGQPRRHRAGEAADRPRRSQPAKPVSVLHRHRPQRARQEPVQRARRHALVHGVSARRDRRLSRLAHAGGRDRRRALRRSTR